MTSTLDKLHAILRRDLLTAVRHRSGFVVTLVGVFTELAAFYFLSRAIGPGFRPGGVEYFPFLLVGTGVYTFFVMSAQAFLSSVQEAQQTGTLEVLMTTSTAPAELVILSSISAFAGNLKSAGLYFCGRGGFPGIHPCQLSFVPRGIGFFSGDRLGSRNRRRHAAGCVPERLGSALAARFWTLVSERNHVPGPEFAPAAELLARAVPLTYAIDGMRNALLEGQSIREMAPTVAALAGFGLLLLPLALAGLSLSLRRARQDGTLSFY